MSKYIKNKQITVTTDFDVNNNRLISVENPIDSQDAATKAYVDSGDTSLETVIESISGQTVDLSSLETEVDGLSASLSSESSVRASADTSLESAIGSLTGDTKLELNQIIGEGQVLGVVGGTLTGVTNIQQDISVDLETEISNRISGDNSLASEINSITGTTANIPSLETVVDSNISEISSESSVRSSADTSLSTAISSESSIRTSADTSLSTTISSESSVRTSADTSLSTAISSESSIRTSADTSLSTRLDTHTHHQLHQPNGTNPFVYTDNAGNLIINGNIIQSGTTFTTDLETLRVANDYIILRSGATFGLGPGEYTGFQAKVYDGVNDGRLVYDSGGTARVGDVGDEQPLATRIETPTDGYFAYWDGTNLRLDFKQLGINDIDNLSTTLSTETSERISGDNSLASEIDSITGTTSDLTSLETAVSGEISNRISGDDSLTSEIDGVSSELSIESSVRFSVDSSLEEEISSETSERISGDNSLTSEIDDLSTDISTETSIRTSADTSLSTAISSESSIRSSADTSLSTAISSESSIRSSADTSLSTAISSESSIRTSADNSLSSAIDGMVAEVDLSTSATASDVTIVNSAGDNATIVGATTTAAGLVTTSSQSWNGLKTFNNAINVGNTTNTTSGNIRYTGSDIQGRVGGDWVSLTGGNIDLGTSVSGTQIEITNTGGNNAILSGADASNAGLVTTGNQTFAGLKTFTNKLEVASTGTQLELGSPTTNADTMLIDRISGQASIKSIDTATGGWLMMDGAGLDGKVGINFYSSGDVVLANGGGNVGIGTTSPSEKLDVDGGINVRDYVRAGNGSASTPTYSFRDTTTMGMYRSAANHLSFSTNSTERVRISSSGQVGIGETSLDFPLQILDTTGTGGIKLNQGSIGDGMSGRIYFRKTSTATGTNYSSYIGGERATSGNELIFGTVVTLSSSPTESMRLRGNADLEVEGDVVAFASSDKRLKENIETLNNSLYVIDKLNPVSFNWNTEAKEFSVSKNTDNIQYGLIAQELEEILPELVHDKYKGKYKGIDYEQLIPLLISSIKELKGEIEKLKNK